MSDYRDLLEKTRRSFQPPDGGIDEIYLGRDRRRRHQRVTAGAVGLAIGLAVIFAGSGAIHFGGQTPADDSPTTIRFGQIAITTDGSIWLIDPSTGNLSRSVDLPTGLGLGGYTITGFTWSPDGTRFAYVTEQRGTVRVYDLETGQTSTIVPCGSPSRYHAGCARSVAWSPDGSRIAVSGGRGLYLVDPDGSNPTALIQLTVRQDGFVGPATWSPDGSAIAFSGSLPGSRDVPAIYEVDADGTNVRVLLKQPGAASVSGPRWSPDGSQIAYLVAARGSGFAHTPAPPIIPQVWIIDADGSNPRQVFEGGACCAGGNWTGLSWSPDGSKIAFIATPPETPYDRPHDAQSVRPRLYAIDPLSGTAQVIATDMPLAGPPVWQPTP
jgi:Tol biopolymer transport system component